MAQGPNEARFRTSLHGASWEGVDAGADEWDRCARLLDVVSRSLQTAAGKDQQIGGRTGPAMGSAFRRTSRSVADRADLLREGRSALRRAGGALKDAEDARVAMDAQHPAVADPGSWNRPVGPLSEDDLQDQRRHQQKVQDYQDAYAARERISEKWTRHLDTVFADSTETMKKIHGEPDPPPPPAPGQGGPGAVTPVAGSPQGPRDPWDDGGGPEDDGPDGVEDDPRGPEDDGTDTGDHSGDHGNDGSDGADGSDASDGSGDGVADTPPLHTGHETDGGGLSTGTLGGLAAGAGGGAVALGGLRGGLGVPGAVSSTGARPIGSTGRVGTSGPLGRGAAVTPGSPVTPSGGAGGAGRGAAGRGGAGTGSPVTRGGRGGPGGRGTGSPVTRAGRGGVGGIGTGRGSGRKDEERTQAPRDLFDDGQDWIDDEGIAPDVID